MRVLVALLLVAASSLLAGCSVLEYDVDISLLGKPVDLYREGLEIRVDGHLAMAIPDGGRIEVGLSSNGDVLSGIGPFEATPSDGKRGMQSRFTFRATVVAAPGPVYLTVWWALYGPSSDVPGWSGSDAVYLTGDGTAAMYHGRRAPDVSWPHHGRSMNEMLSVTPSENFTSYRLEFRNLSERTFHGWTVACLHDFTQGCDAYNPHEARPFRLEAGETLEENFERGPWREGAVRELDFVGLRFHPSIGSLEGRSFVLVRDEAGRLNEVPWGTGA